MLHHTDCNKLDATLYSERSGTGKCFIAIECTPGKLTWDKNGCHCLGEMAVHMQYWPLVGLVFKCVDISFRLLKYFQMQTGFWMISKGCFPRGKCTMLC